jgi:hypothetical protein
MQDYDRTISSPTGQPVAQILLDTVGEKGALALLFVVCSIYVLIHPLY